MLLVDILSYIKIFICSRANPMSPSILFRALNPSISQFDKALKMNELKFIRTFSTLKHT